MDSLFILAAKKTHPCHSKDIMSRSMDMSPQCDAIFFEKTTRVDIMLESSDEYGLDFHISFLKPSGSIDLFFHKKKTCYSTVTVRDSMAAPVLSMKHKGIVLGPFAEYVLSDCPRFIKEFIIGRFNKKWKNLMEVSKTFMNLKKSLYSVHVECRGGDHSFMYH